MTNSEYNMLVRVINDMELEKGKVLKANGKWYIEGTKSEVPRPIIKLPHWTEGTKKVVLDQDPPPIVDGLLFETVANYSTGIGKS